MAVEPIITGAPRMAGIPIPQQTDVAARALDGFVDTLSNIDAQKRDVDFKVAQIQQRNREATEASTGQIAIIQIDAEARERLMKLREDPNLSLDDHERESRVIIDELRNRMLGSFATESVRERFAPEIERDVQELAAREGAFRQGQRRKLQAAAGDAVFNKSGAAILADPTPETSARERGRMRTFRDTIPMDAATAAAYDAEADKTVLRSLVDGLTAKGDFEGALAVAGSADYARRFGAEGVKAVQTRVSAEQRAMAAAANAAAAAGRKAAEKQADAIMAMIDEGGVVPDRQIEAAIGAAQAAGVDQAKIIRLQGSAADQAINKAFGAAADPEGTRTRAEIERLTAVRAAREFTSAENMTFERLKKITGVRVESAAERLKPMFGKSPANDLQVLGEIDKRPAPDRFDVANAVSPGLGYVQLLTGADRQFAIEGHHDLKANPDLIKVAGPSGGKRDRFTPEFRTHLGGIVNQLPEATIAGYQGTAEALYATYLKKSGKTGWQPDLFVLASNVAMGAKRRDGKWYGGLGLVNNRHVMLPDWSTADGIETALARSDYSDARYANGKPAGKADVLQNYLPVLEEGGEAGKPAAYIFVNAAGQALKDARGEDYRKLLRAAR